jgi:murein DD-endopeptidase MepM/ murein hydrolase activator NlpD
MPAAAPAVPVPPIPTIPANGPIVLVHLERLIPVSLSEKFSVSSWKTARSMSPITSGDLVPVFPPISGLEYESRIAADLGFEPVDPDHLDFIWPVGTRSISSAFGPRIRTQTVRVVKANKKRLIRRRYQGSHKGVDLTAPIGSDVYAGQDGRVAFSGMEKGYGNLLIIDHGNGVETRYGHLRIRFAEVGDVVQRGQKIAEVGMTGHTTGPHLHFEVRLNGEARNPLPVLNDVDEIPAEMVALNEQVGAPSK